MNYSLLVIAARVELINTLRSPALRSSNVAMRRIHFGHTKSGTQDVCTFTGVFAKKSVFGGQNFEDKSYRSRGQISVALILVMTVILGAIGLGADMGCFTSIGSSCRKGLTLPPWRAPRTSRATLSPHLKQSQSPKPTQRRMALRTPN